MSEPDRVQLSEMVKMTGLTDGAKGMLHNQQISQVWLWDCGPSKPKMPARPEPPQGKEGSPAYDLAKIEFAEVLEAYTVALKTYRDDVVKFNRFQQDYGGPYLMTQWSVNAREALAHDTRAVEEKRQEKRRYYLASRTRGYENLPNGGLPEGMKPGHRHVENLQRERDGDAEMQYARRRDPVFGEQELRP